MSATALAVDSTNVTWPAPRLSASIPTAPVPAYKSSAAAYLDLTGRIPGALPHPSAPQRPPWEHEMLVDCARRLGCEITVMRMER